MLILDLEAQRKLRGLIARAAERPLSRLLVGQQIAWLRHGQNVNVDVGLCVLIAESYLVSFCFEDALDLGFARHLAVSRGKPPELPARAAVEMLMREVGITSRLGELVSWFQSVPGRGTAVHVLEPMTVFNSIGLSLALQAAALVEDEVVAPAPDDVIEEEAA